MTFIEQMAGWNDNQLQLLKDNLNLQFDKAVDAPRERKDRLFRLIAYISREQKKRKSPRQLGTSPRQTGKSPRQLGKSPRQIKLRNEEIKA